MVFPQSHSRSRFGLRIRGVKRVKVGRITSAALLRLIRGDTFVCLIAARLAVEPELTLGG